MKKNLLAFTLALIGMSAVAQSPRLSLYEEFTGETCPPCASTNPGLNAILLSPTNASKIVAIKWQVPIPSAPSNTWSLYQTNKAEIDWRYRSSTAGGYGYPSQNNATATISSGINSAPSGRIDGQHQWAFGVTAASGNHPTYMSNAVIATAQSYTSAFSVTMQRAWNYNSSAVTLTVNITATAPFTSVGNLVFRTVMVERLIQFSVQPGSNGEKKFEDVAIKSFPSIQAGTPMAGTWTLGQTMTFTMNCPLPSYVRNKEEIALVGFIQDDGNRKVAQAARADKAALPPDGLATVAAKVDVTCGNAITPQITVNNTGSNAITSIGITPYIDGVAGTVINWTGNIPVGTTSIITLGNVPSPTVAGVHTFSYNIISMNAPTYNVTGNSSKVSFLVVGNYQATPVAEGFVTNVAVPAGWALVNPNQGTTWVRSTAAGGQFQLPWQSEMYSFYNNSVIGDVDELIMPPMNLGGGAAPELYFDYSYAQRTPSSDDKLEILVSDNCGSTWSTVWSKSGSMLATADPTNTPFVPNDDQQFSHWVTEIIPLTGFNKSSVLVKFVTTSDNGNNLWIDNVNLSQKNPTGISNITSRSYNLNVYPNPATSVANIRVTSPVASASKVTIFNTIGQVVFEKEITLNEGSNTVAVDVKDFSAGVYNVVINSTNGSVSKKLTVTK